MFLVSYQFWVVKFQGLVNLRPPLLHDSELSFFGGFACCELHLVDHSTRSAAADNRGPCPFSRVLLLGPVPLTGADISSDCPRDSVLGDSSLLDLLWCSVVCACLTTSSSAAVSATSC